MEELEVWKPVIGFEDNYIVSNLGKIKSLKHKTIDKIGRCKTFEERILTIKRNARSGRPCVMLFLNGKRKNVKVYRLVAEAFIPNPENLPCVNHLDGDICNCRVDNLEWCTYSDNLKHSYDELKRPVNISKVFSREVIVYSKITNKTNTYKSIQEANRNIGVSCTQIRRIAKGECINDTYEISIPSLSNNNE